MGLISFIFGKKPLIVFTKDGRAKHEHTDKKWEEWKDRFRKNPEFNWRNHIGTKAGKK